MGERGRYKEIESARESGSERGRALERGLAGDRERGTERGREIESAEREGESGRGSERER